MVGIITRGFAAGPAGGKEVGRRKTKNPNSFFMSMKHYHAQNEHCFLITDLSPKEKVFLVVQRCL